MKCTVMIWRLWVRTPVKPNLRCVALLFQSHLNQIYYENFRELFEVQKHFEGILYAYLCANEVLRSDRCDVVVRQLQFVQLEMRAVALEVWYLGESGIITADGHLTVHMPTGTARSRLQVTRLRLADDEGHLEEEKNCYGHQHLETSWVP